METSQPSEMMLMWLAKDVVKTWNEEFIDEDTSQPVSIKRSELLFRAGDFIDDDTLAKIRFFMQEGSIESVTVANQRRLAYQLEAKTFRSYVINAEVGDSTAKFLLRAADVNNAIEIFKDYAETKFYRRGYFITSIKEVNGIILTENMARIDTRQLIDMYINNRIDYKYLLHHILSDILPLELQANNEEVVKQDKDSSWTQITILFRFEEDKEAKEKDAPTDLFGNPIVEKEEDEGIKEDDEGFIEKSFIVYAENSERAISLCVSLIKMLNDASRKREGYSPMKLVYTLKKAAPFSVGYYIPMELSLEYNRE